MTPPTFADWIEREYPQVVEAWRWGQCQPDGTPNAGLPSHEWAAFQTLRRFSRWIPGLNESWTLRQMVEHELGFRPVHLPPAPIVLPDDEIAPLPTTDPLALRGDWLTFRLNGRVHYLGDNPATDEACAAYRAHGYTDILVASVLGPQPGADAPFDLFGQPDAYAERCAGFQSRGIRAIGQIGFEDAWDVWAKYRSDFPAHIRRLVRAADPHVSSWLWGVEIDEGLTLKRKHYTWDDLIAWMRVLSEVSQRPQLVHFRQTAWGPEGDAPWHGGRQASWWRAVRAALPTTPLACAFQHRHDKPAHKRANGGFLSPQLDVSDHVAALNEPKRLGGINVKMISFEYAWNGTDNDAQIVPEAEAKALGQYALSVGAFGAMNGV